MSKEYEPFGPEWEKEMKKTSRPFLIEQFKRLALEKIDWQNSDPAFDQHKLTMLINFVNQEMGNECEWNGEYWQWKK